jgi:hypothetical protein
MTQSSRANEPEPLRRMALAPGLLGAIVAIAGVFAIGNEFFFAVSFVIAVLALIIGWFAVQSLQWWWLPLPAAIAVVWNPVIPLALADAVWLPLQYAAAAGFIVAGLVIRVSDHDR